MLCVSIHDVAPATWPDCLRLVQAVREVADIPLTWLVVPHYHFRPERSPAMEACLDVVLERGDELTLHGYSHLDTEGGGGGLRGRFLRNVYTRREGEFAALDEAEARRRLEQGLAWFAERNWTTTGFIPPAWLLGKDAWRALRAAPFAYTTTFSHFHCLRDAAGHPVEHSVLSPSLVYAARNRGGRLLSPRVADATAKMFANAPLLRFSLHPPDARYPELVRHIQRVLERQLAVREAVTKAECARRLVAARALSLDAERDGRRMAAEPMLVVSGTGAAAVPDAAEVADAAAVIAVEDGRTAAAAAPGACRAGDTGTGKTGPVETAAVETDVLHTEAADTDVAKAIVVDTESVETETVDRDAADNEVAKAVTVDTEPVETAAVEAETIDTEAAKAGAADTEAGTQAACAHAVARADAANAGADEGRGSDGSVATDVSGGSTCQRGVDFGNRHAVMPVLASRPGVTSVRRASARGPSRSKDSYRRADSHPVD